MPADEKEGNEAKPDNDADFIPSRDWGSILKFPLEQAIAEFNKTSVNRSPYLAG